ncbi:MAG: golvesin C-terminal-like domain-containing protein, partial [Candidatus Freyarchaeota archaeon]
MNGPRIVKSITLFLIIVIILSIGVPLMMVTTQSQSQLETVKNQALIGTLTSTFNVQTGISVRATEIIVDTEKGETRFETQPPRQLPYYWFWVRNHDTFQTRAYNGNFWYTLCGEEGRGEPLYYGVWTVSLPQSGKYEVFVWIPNPDPFEYDGRVYTPTQSAVYQIYHKDGLTTKTVNQRLRTGSFYSLGTFNFDTTAKVILNDRTGEPYCSTMIAFDAIKFVLVNQPPTAVIDYITPNPAQQGKDTVSFAGSGTDPDGYVV